MKYFLSFVFIFFSIVEIQSQSIVSDSLNKIFNLKVDSGDWIVYWNDTHCMLFDKLNQSVDTIFANLYLTAKENDGCLTNNRYKILSIVGPFVSFLSLEFQDCELGNHPTDYVYYSTFNMQTKKTVSLTNIFQNKILFNSLIKTTWVKKYLQNPLPKNLKELINKLDGGCEVSFMYLLEHFAFKSISDSTVIVQFGLEHGCEADKGNFTNFELKLPIPEQYMGYFNQANKNESTVKYLIDKNYLKKLSERNN